MTFAHLNRKSSLYFFWRAIQKEYVAIENSEFFLFLMHIVLRIITNKRNSNIFGNELKSLYYGSSPLSDE